MPSSSFSKNISDLTPSDFWMICGSDGTVSMCSPDATRHGIIPGKSCLFDVLVPADRLTAEDSLKKYGTVSLCLRVLPEYGYSVAHVIKSVLFSTDITEIRLYKSKDAMGMSEAIPNYAPSLADKVDELLRTLKMSSIPSELGRRLTILASDIKKLSCENELMLYHHKDSNDGAFDAADVLRRMEISLSNTHGFPYNFRFDHGKADPVFFGSVRDFVGICYTAGTVAAKLSQSGSCRIGICAAGDDSVLEISSKSDRSIPFLGRTFNLSSVRDLLPLCHTELMLLEDLTSPDNLSFYFEKDPSGEITFRFSFSAAYDPYRLKYRDFTADAEEAISLYSRHILTLSSDTEDKG